LRSLLPSADGERCRVVLLGGEAGSGKSRLVREFAAEASRDGALVLYGACDAVVHTPYGAVVEALQALARTLTPGELRAAVGNGAGELTRLLPDLSARIGDVAPPPRADPDTERHRLHTAVADVLDAVTRSRPALLAIEDVHWADAPTLLLLRHLARAGSARVLLLATFRDIETDVSEALAETLADLRRYDVVRLRLAGLSGDEVAEFVRRAGGADGHELAAAIRDLTDGNPFLVCELWRALVETGTVEIGEAIRLTRPLAEIASPESVREVVSQRLSRLSPWTTDLLELAATAGAEFDLEIVRRAAGLREPELLSALDEAVRSGMIEELPAPGLPCRFAHDLVSRALYDRLSGPRRAELHLRVGEALETAETRSVADLAHHFAAAMPFGDVDRAIEYNVLAARAAARALAFDEAAARLRAALALGARSPEIFVELGYACHLGGKAVDAIQAFRTAADRAGADCDATLLAQAAIGFEDACWRPGMADQGAVELLEQAAAALGEDDSELRVGLLSGLARALDFQGERERGSVVRTNAVAMARRLDDRTGLATVLMRSYWSRGTTSLDEILAMLTEARDIGDALGNTEIRAEAMAWRVPAFVALCDHEAARNEVALLRETAEQTAQPFMLHVAEHYGSAIALCDGRLEAAETLARRSHEWGRLLTGRDPSGVYGIQMFSVRRERGRLAELAPVIRILASDPEREGPWRPGFVALLAELGMDAEARRELSRVLADGLDPFRDSLWLASLAYLTDACSALGDANAAALVYRELEPFGGGNVMIGHLVSCYGAADRYLGMLAATAGDAERAERHFVLALELNRSMGAATWVAHTAYEHGRFLLAQQAGDRARELLGEAAALAQRIGMPTLLSRIRALGPTAPEAGYPDGLSPREVQILGLVAQGLSNRHVGTALSISEHTAANHVRSILRKTGCANRTEAASYYHRHGLASV
jgi:DNA-binding CsgD family transcriptional regulator